MGWDPYGTLAVPLAAAVLRAPDGPVLELGVGETSTPLLHAMCRDRRHLISAETDLSWLEKFKQFKTRQHELMLVETPWEAWTGVEIANRWAVALVDCAPGEARAALVARLAQRAHFVLAHDSEKDYGAGTNYRYEDVVPLFKYVVEYRYLRPYTLILSNYEPFELDEVEKSWTPSEVRL